MLILHDQNGQLCNRLWSSAPFAAFCLATGQRMMVPFMGQYARLFDDLNQYEDIRFVRLHGAIYRRAMRHVLQGLRTISAPLLRRAWIDVDPARWGNEDWSHEILADRRRTVLLSGWSHPRPIVDLSPHRSHLRTLFAPAACHVDQAEACVTALRSKKRHVAGVHIRRGDYAAFRNGGLFFSWESYCDAMHSIDRQLGGDVAFLICSNEPVDTAAFAGLKFAVLPDANSVSDLHALSLCDYIMGPPSTFSMWASFYGNVPLRFLLHADDRPTIAEFRPMVGFNRFADGSNSAFLFRS